MSDSRTKAAIPTSSNFNPAHQLPGNRSFVARSQAHKTNAFPQSEQSQKLDAGVMDALGIQAQLAIGAPGDKYEQEADTVAAQVVEQIHSPQAQQKAIQRQETPDEEDELMMKPLRQSIQRQEVPKEEDELMMKPLGQSIQRQEVPEEEDELMMKPLGQSIQRQEIPEEEDELMMKPSVQRQADGGGAASADLESSINGARGNGQPLSEGVRGSMEQAFGADFSTVNIHTGSEAHQLNESIQARAFTTGQDIFFRQGEYQPDSRGGQELLAHELTHVVQQNPVAVRAKPISSLTANRTIQRDPPTAEGSPAEASPYDAIQDYVNDVASEWGLLAGRFSLALRNFTRRMTMTSEDEAVPDVTGALVKHVTSQITTAALSKVEGLVPGWAEVKGALDVMTGELDRADTARQELALRDFMMTVDTVTTEGFESQVRAVRSGRPDLVDEYNDLAPEIQPLFIESLSNWLETLRREMPTHEDYEASLYVEWLNMHQGQLRGFDELGAIEIKFNAEEPGVYDFESAKVMSTYANKAASGLNWVMSTPGTGATNILDLPVRKRVGLYVENIVGGMSYGWFHLDADNNTTQRSVVPMAVRRWAAMPWAPLEAITEVSG